MSFLLLSCGADLLELTVFDTCLTAELFYLPCSLLEVLVQLFVALASESQLADQLLALLSVLVYPDLRAVATERAFVLLRATEECQSQRAAARAGNVRPD